MNVMFIGRPPLREITLARVASVTAVNDFDARRRLSRFVIGQRHSAAERMRRTRERRRRGQMLAALRVEQIEIRKLVALRYLERQ